MCCRYYMEMSPDLREIIEEANRASLNRGRTGHVSTGIPDDPAMFDQVISLLQHAQNAFLAAFESTVAQYHPSMVTEEHSDLIRRLIDHIADTAENILEKHLTDTNKEENEHES